MPRYVLLPQVLLILFLSRATHLEAGGPFQFHTLTPCRIVDTRNAIGPAGGPVLEDDTDRQFPVQDECEIPIGVRAVFLNITATSPTNNGHFRLYPSDLPRPGVSTVNFAAGSISTANGAIVALADDSVQDLDLTVYTRVAGGGTVHLVIDVAGYFQ